MTEPFKIIAYANRDYEQEYIYTSDGAAVDMTGWTFEMQIRVQPGQTGTPLTTAFISLIEPAAGRIVASIGAATLNAIRGADPFAPRILFFDLLATPADGHTHAILDGQFHLYPGVTRA